MPANPVVARAFLHMWEEPCISGKRGSGAVFFSGCNLKCIFCQNHEISHGGRGKEISAAGLAGIFLSLRDKGAHNINLVTPTHFIPSVLEALSIARAGANADNVEYSGNMAHADSGDILHDDGGTIIYGNGGARPGLNIPVVYNTNAYETIDSLKLLEGSIDIYLPDLKYVDPGLSKEYSGAGDYFENASKAILEMYRQVGSPVFDKDGLLQKGMIIRHLVLPGSTADSVRVLEWISDNLPKSVYVSLMSQFVPCYHAVGHPVLDRHITRHEYDKVVNKFVKLGLNGYVQERESASEQYIPDFDIVKFQA
ncbi:MAG TPA: radical SAM protein [Clostridia bacterium]|nr:radical SAM protein [Clostridia bacterium]